MDDDGGTVVSAADMIHFKFLANPTVVDVTDVDAVDVEDATSPIRDAAAPSFPTITPEDEATSFGLLADAASLPRTGAPENIGKRTDTEGQPMNE